ncbi:MAG: biopolymer transporter ExbD [Pseudomonadales bacterium]|nr:biopolymer transporter ExbD [Pseudomonadales bacterium]
MLNKRRSRRRYNDEAVELNITAFLNLMVILIPFLLITAVFSKLAILELNIASEGIAEAQDDSISVNLELVIRQNSFDIQSSNIGVIRRLVRHAGNEDWSQFSKLLIEIKSLYPVEQKITLLLEPGIPYKTLISVMDKVKSAQIQDGISTKQFILFPVISIGDALEIEPESMPQEKPGMDELGLVQ